MGAASPLPGKDVQHRAMATCHMVQSEQPDSPGKHLHPLLTFPGGSSFKPWMQFKNTLARCLLKNGYCWWEQQHRPRAGMPYHARSTGCAPGADGAQLNFRAAFLAGCSKWLWRQQHVGTCHPPASGVPVRAGSPTRTWRGMI